MNSYAIIVVVTISVLGIGTFSQSASAELSGEVNIGLLQPISGGVSNHGEENREAAKLAIIDFNQYLADKGANWSLVMIIEDSQTQPAMTLEKVRALHAKGINVMVAGILQTSKGMLTTVTWLQSAAVPRHHSLQSRATAYSGCPLMTPTRELYLHDSWPMQESRLQSRYGGKTHGL